MLDSNALGTYLKDKTFDFLIHTAISGGRRTKEETVEVVYQNLLMFENIIKFADKSTDAYKEANDALNRKTGFLKNINDLTEKELKAEEKIQKTLGYTGALFGGIQKSLEKIGIESESFEHLNKDLREAAKSGNSFSVIGTGLKSMGKGIMESFKDPLVQITLITGAFHELYKIGVDFSNEAADLAKTIGVSNEEAGHLVHHMEEMAASSGDNLANTKNNLKSFKELNDVFGVNVEFSQKQLLTQTKLQEVAGLTTEEAGKLAGYEQLTGKSAEDIYNSIGKQNKGVLNQKKITQEVLKTSGQLAAQYKNNPELIAKAVTQAQKLGMTLEQTKNISKNLLNFEDSISAELEAELLTGQDLNLERARGLALQGDTAGAAAELMKNLGPNGLQKFQKMNVIQQESYAKALGMSTDELADSLVKQKQLQEIGTVNATALKKRVKELQDEGKVEQAAELEKQVLAGKTLELADQRLGAEANLKQSIEKTKDSLSSMIAGPLGSIAGMVNSVIEKINKIPGIGSILGIVGAIGAVGALLAGVAILVKTVKSLLGKGPADQTAANTKEIADNTAKMANNSGGSGGSSGGGGDDDGYDGPRNKDGSPDKRSKAYKKHKNKKSRGGKRKGKFGKLLGGLGVASSLLGLGGDDEGGDDLASSAMDMASSTSGSGGGFISKMMGGASKMMSNLNPMKALKSAFSGPNLKKIVGYLPKVGKLAQLAMTAYSLYSGAKGIAGAAQDGASYQDVGKEAVQSLGDLGGTVIGGMVGSIIPGAGTIIGGLLGGMGGSALAGLIADNVDLTGFGKAVVDVLGPGKPMATGGIVTGPTRALIGEAGSEAVIPLKQFYEKLDELIHAVKSGGNVYLDATKVGTAMNVGTYKLQ
jgi:hypothetical protein